MYMYTYALISCAFGGNEQRKQEKKKQGRCVSREVLGEEDASFYEVLRYRWRGVSCDNAHYYVLPSESAIDGMTDRSIEGTFQ